jgi:Big-like domain-containing protein
MVLYQINRNRCVSDRRLLFCALASLAFTFACADHSAPAPTPTPGPVVISPEVATLKVSEVQQLTVVQSFSDGSTRILQASWSTSDPAVASVDQGGTVSAIQAGSVTLTAHLQSQNVSVSLVVVADVSGQWAGEFRFTDCSRISGSGPNPCAVPINQPMTLSLSQVHDLLTGSMRVFINGDTGLVSGSVNVDGTFTIQGTLKGENEIDTLSDWQSQVSAASMAGHFTMTRSFTNFFGA